MYLQGRRLDHSHAVRIANKYHAVDILLGYLSEVVGEDVCIGCYSSYTAGRVAITQEKKLVNTADITNLPLVSISNVLDRHFHFAKD